MDQPPVISANFEQNMASSPSLADITVHYKVPSGHRDNFLTFFKPFQLLPPDCLPESPVSIDSESVIKIQIGRLLVGVFCC